MHSVVVAYVLAVAVCIPLSGLARRSFWGTHNLFSGHCHFYAGFNCQVHHRAESTAGISYYSRYRGCIAVACRRLAAQIDSTRSIFIGHEFIESGGVDWSLIGPTLGGWLVEVATLHWIF